MSNFQGGLEFTNVVFSYPATPNINAINEMSFKINSGQTVAMVGRSGCGMDAIFRLIARFYDPEDGLVYYNNNNNSFFYLN